MSKSSLIAVLALIATVSAKPYIYYGPLASSSSYLDLYNPAVASLGSYSSYPAAYSLAYTNTYPANYLSPLSGSASAQLSLPGVYGSSYVVEEQASALPLVNPAPVAPAVSAAAVPSSVYGWPLYSYYYKR
ncbi:unnamed protein product [Spodoptera exigua]|nr:unnamed protein product [Spodoptera exigua]